VIASFFGGIHGFFQSTLWSAIQTVGALFLVLLWGATIYWVRKDARRRTKSRTLVSLATLLGAVLPFLGPLVYMLFRPPEYLEDVRERDLEIKAIEQRLTARTCPVCGAEVEADFLVCPVCTTKLRKPCAKCQRPLEPAWQLCPYCETRVGAADDPVALRPKRTPRTSRTSEKPG
jgi:RNA polymerase subunit RPABC4/transcription elongation factor Spt4